MNKLLRQARVTYYSDKVESCGRDHKSLFKITKNILGGSNEVILPSNASSKKLAQDFSDFFINKIECIRSEITSHAQSDSRSVDLEIDQDSLVRPGRRFGHVLPP